MNHASLPLPLSLSLSPPPTPPFSVVQQPNTDLGRLAAEVSRSHTDTYTPGSSPLDDWSACRRGRYLYNTQQSQETNIHASGGIGNHDPSKRTVADLRHRSRGHWDRQLITHINEYVILHSYRYCDEPVLCEWVLKMFPYASVPVYM
jgi:hypothetical protein